MVEDNCLRIRAEYDNTSWLPVWPPEFTLIDENGTLAIRNGEQQIRARVGDRVQVGGGTIPDDEAAWLGTEMLRQKPPEACPGPYWLASDDVAVVPQ